MVAILLTVPGSDGSLPVAVATTPVKKYVVLGFNPVALTCVPLNPGILAVPLLTMVPD